MSYQQKGFSLVGALVGLAVVGGIGLVIMQQQESSSKMQSKDNADQVVNSAANIVQIALANRAVCSLSLKNKGVGDTVPTLFDAQVSPTNINAEVIVGPNLLEIDQLLPHDVKIQEMKIILDPTDGKEYLNVTFNRNPTGRKKMFGSDVVGRKFQLQGEKNPTTQKYITCYSEMSNAISTAHQQACTDAGGSWNGGDCVFSTSPIYFDSVKGALVANSPVPSQRFSCTSCGPSPRCNPCPAGWTNVGGVGLQLGGVCAGGFPFKLTHTWSYNCTNSTSAAPYGEILNNIP